MADANPMKEIRVEKITFNVGVGEAGQKLENAKTLLNKITGKTPVTTLARIRSPTWKIKKGDPIGAKVTVRGNEAGELLKRALQAVDQRLKPTSFDRSGNISFGVHEYIDFPGVKYDPKIGVIGFDVCVTISRKGGRVRSRRRFKARRIGPKHRITRDEGVAFMTEKFGVKLAE